MNDANILFTLTWMKRFTACKTLRIFRISFELFSFMPVTVVLLISIDEIIDPTIYGAMPFCA